MADQPPELQAKLADLDHELEVGWRFRLEDFFLSLTHARADIKFHSQEGDITKKGYVETAPFLVSVANLDARGARLVGRSSSPS